MIGNWKWNATLASVGFAFTFLLSMGRNVWTTTLTRSLTSALVFFLLAFVIRLLFGLVLNVSSAGNPHDKQDSQEEVNDDKASGHHFDMSTPDEEAELIKMLAPNAPETSEFQPLNAPKLTKKADMDPEYMAQVLRQMSEE
ncbi:hypothetical protein [Gorillibacterium massiliense]|uniref:hypothetical protein n=1 Tax=Gorillibacterium massiliense TaxID=1280390 RepID=UPI0004B75122|nr:hypothetical protein [Gorillibacterium massiliense]